MLRSSLFAGLLVLAGFAADLLPGPGQEVPEDFTKADLKTLGVEPVSPRKDPKTGFVVGGKNETALIRKLTEIAGRRIASLEKDMRPGQLSRLGFLGKDESLLDVLAMDNGYVVEQLGLTHQELARHLHVLGAVALRQYRADTKAGRKPAGREILYHGKRFKLTAACFRGLITSPFEDDTKTNCEATVQNVGTGKKLTYSLLIPHMVERYGFYEGKGTPYRVDPRAILDVLDFLRPKKA
ncbi:MAG: hypothetical protein IT429_03680 [Gemmataceae bacterium]|nr:hypothetical protein [Gemmataceae bacterium]